MSEKHQWQADDFELIQKLGEGRFGTVHLAREKNSRFVLAIKTLSKAELKELNAFRQLRREVEIQNSLKHPNVLQLYCYFYDDKNVYLLLEFAKGGDLYGKIRANGRLSEAQTVVYIYQIVHALMYLHSKKIIHRDIKPENILIGTDGKLKLSDFGWSIRSLNFKRTTMCGTMDYLSPEQAMNKDYDFSVDLWSLGVLSYECLTGKAPFESKNNTTYGKIVNIDYEVPEYVSPTAKDFIKRLIVKDPSQRMSLKEAVKHSFLAQCTQKVKDYYAYINRKLNLE